MVNFFTAINKFSYLAYTTMLIVAPIFIRLLTGNFARAMAIFPFIFLRDKALKGESMLINHEKIHFAQQKELLILPFFVLYTLEYLIHRFKGKSHIQAYFAISFEKEAYYFESDLDYLKTRKWFQWRMFI